MIHDGLNDEDCRKETYTQQTMLYLLQQILRVFTGSSASSVTWKVCFAGIGCHRPVRAFVNLKSNYKMIYAIKSILYII